MTYDNDCPRAQKACSKAIEGELTFHGIEHFVS